MGAISFSEQVELRRLRDHADGELSRLGALDVMHANGGLTLVDLVRESDAVLRQITLAHVRAQAIARESGDASSSVTAEIWKLSLQAARFRASLLGLERAVS